MLITSRLAPLAARSRSRIGLRSHVLDGAARTWQISPPVEPASLPAAVFEEADLQRITGVAPSSGSIASEIRIVRARGGRHGPTVAHELRHAVLSRGHLFTWRGWSRVGHGRVPALARGALREYRSAAFGSTDFGQRYFGHWMTDDLPLLLAATELGPTVSTLRHPTPTQHTLLRLLAPDTDVATDAYFERLVVLDDIGQNLYKRQRYLKIRARLAEWIEAPLSCPGVMLLRGSSGEKRVLANEQGVAASLERRGWKVLDPQTADLTEIVRLCAGARIILGVEGSQLTNGMMCMPSGAALLVIQPPQRFCMVLKHYCDCVDSPYAFIVGTAANDNDFSIDNDALHRLIDRLERRRA